MSTEIAPGTPDDPVLAARIDDLLHRTCDLARALTGAEQAALKVDLDGAAWEAFGTQADSHPALRGWLATPVYSEDADRRPYGLLELSGKTGGQEFSPDDAARLLKLATFASATLDALRHAVAQSLEARR